MERPKEHRIWICRNSVGAAAGALALAIVFMLTVVASQAAQAQTFNVLHIFTGGQDGATPEAGLTMDKGGNLYGTAYGSSTYGTVYRLKRSGSNWIFNPLFNFDGSDGSFPIARVIFGPDGVLYGTTSATGLGCCGEVFRLAPLPVACKAALCSWQKTVLYAFKGSGDGAFPGNGDLIFDQQGNIYGTTTTGGPVRCTQFGETCGVVFELSPSSGGGWTETVLYTFPNGNDGASPYAGLVFDIDGSGRLYGTNNNEYYGGNPATVFQLTPSWTETILHTFSGGNDGAVPWSGLVFDQARNLYGTTSDYGTGGGGTAFVFYPSGSSWQYNPLYSFTGTETKQCGPRGTLVMDGAGNLYGTTYCDGTNNLGSVFKLTNSGGGNWTYKSLHDFTGGSDGKLPYGSVTFDASGNLYGTASAGGSQGVGVVWEITP